MMISRLGGPGDDDISAGDPGDYDVLYYSLSAWRRCKRILGLGRSVREIAFPLSNPATHLLFRKSDARNGFEMGGLMECLRWSSNMFWGNLSNFIAKICQIYNFIAKHLPNS